METKRLCKSSTDKALTGVCGGFGEYFGVDSLIVRLILVLFTLVWGAGLWFYIIAALIMPKEEAVYGRDDIGRYTPSSNAGTYAETGYTESDTSEASSQTGEFKDVDPITEEEAYAGGQQSRPQPQPEYRSYTPQHSSASATAVLGIALVALGGLYLLRYFLPRFPVAPLLAGAAVILGLILIVKKH